MNWGLHWFRRDLRLAGNPALIDLCKRANGRILGLFCFDADFLSRSDFSHDRFAFFIDTLAALREELRACGGDLLVLDGAPELAFPRLFSLLQRHTISLPRWISFNRDYEPFARRRDETVAHLLQKEFACEVLSHRDHLVVEPTEVKKPDGGYYRIYTPFSKQWLALLNSGQLRARLDASFIQPDQMSLRWHELLGDQLTQLDSLDAFKSKNQGRVSVPIPRAGSLAARKCLSAFRSKIEEYGQRRDFPAQKATSQISIFLKNGSLTVSQVIAELGLHLGTMQSKSRLHYLKELIWREFYYHILWHCPRVETESFIEKYRELPWENNPELFDAWREGRTGYPLVDAGMRQLKATGWMHNRVRMVVASFLTKDLLIDWRWGERHFMEKLLDGDLAPNNGGWQWAASTGCDPQPYFRIFNPTLQSQTFDPDGEYIKRWCPELSSLSGPALHQPRNPIVVHASQKLKALQLYRSQD